MKKILLLFVFFISTTYYTTAQAPANNSLANATEITSFPLIDNNVRIDLSGLSQGGQASCSIANFKTVYYKFTATESSIINVQLSDSNGGALGQNYAIFYTASSNNATNENELTGYSNCAYGNGFTGVSVNAGQDYYILIHRVDVNVSTNIIITKLIDVPLVEKNALIDLYNATNGNSWTTNSNWGAATPVSNWHGVTVTNNRVTGLDLGSNNLVGSIPESIGNLTELTNLNLINNTLSGNIPDQIWNLNKLVNLWLGAQNNNGLTFANGIPASISNMTNLFWLNIAGVPLTQPLQPALFTLPNLSKLRIYNCGLEGTLPPELVNIDDVMAYDNNFSGVIPQEILNASGNLRLSIYGNKFNFGDLIPLIQANGYTNLNYTPQQNYSDDVIELVTVGDNLNLDASTSGTNNQYQWYKDGFLLSGETNATLSLTNIQITDFGDYYCLVTNTNASGLTLISGNFTVDIAPASHPDYNTLVAFYNATNGSNWTNNTNWLDTSKPISTWFGVTETNGRVSGLSLFNNNLTGQLPNEIGNLDSLTFIQISSNNLNGELPASIGNLTNLNSLAIYQCQFTGLLPNSIQNLTNLTYLGVFDNSFSGDFPELTNLQNLITLEISNNNFTGNVPINPTNNPSITNISLNNNSFESTIPDFTTLSNLNVLWIQENKFQFGDFENQFATYSNGSTNFAYSPQQNYLEETYHIITLGGSIILDGTISGNGNQYQWYKDGTLLTGETNATLSLSNIQQNNLGSYTCNVTSSIVTNLTITSNPFNVGIDPTSHPDYNALVQIYNDNNGQFWTNNTNWLDTSKPISTWFGITETNGRVTQLSLNNNLLSGEISPAFGDLTQLERLFLFGNAFRGSIPPELGNLSNLQLLYLYSMPNITGNIPQELTNLTNLAQLAVHECNLEGPIPDFTANNNLALFWIQDNKFEFGDFENQFVTYQANIGSFNFSPQKFVQEINGYGLNIGDTQVLTASVSGSQNNYQWYKDNVAISGATSSTYSLTINSTADYGTYVYIATSNIVSGLTLQSTPIVINEPASNHPDYNALVAIYNSTNGANWTNTWDLNAPISTWYGLTFDTNNRVSELDLASNNLTGTIPTEVGNLSELTRLSFFINDITGNVPDEIWNLTKLRELFIGGQESEQLVFANGIPSLISNMVNLEWLNVANIPLSQPLQPALFNLPNLNRLRIQNCGISGTLPVGLTNINDVLAYGNEFEGAIPQEFIDNVNGNNRLFIYDNYFNFSDLQPLVQANSYNTLGYSPQKTRDEALTLNASVGENITLTVNNQGVATRVIENAIRASDNTYQWFKDNTPIAGATDHTYIITNAQASDSGTYYCEIRNATVTSLVIRRADIIINIGTVLSTADEILDAIKIYPNPTNGLFTIKLNQQLENVNIKLFDINGRQILKRKLNNLIDEVDISSLSAGVYLLNIESNGKRKIHRIVKQ